MTIHLAQDADFLLRFLRQAGLSDGAGHDVRIAVGSRPAVLQISTFVLVHVDGDADAGGAAADRRCELVDVRRLAEAGESSSVVSSSVWIRDADVLGVTNT